MKAAPPRKTFIRVNASIVFSSHLCWFCLSIAILNHARYRQPHIKMHFSGAIFASIFLAQGSFAIPTLNTLFARTPKDGPVLLQNWNAVADAYMKAVQPASIVKHNTWIETIPDACYTYATKAINASEPNLNRPHCPSINDLKVFEVWYSDSPKPWLFCRCSNSAFSEAELLDRVGRVPAAIRQRTRYIMSFKDGPTGIGGYALSSKDIVMFGTPGMTTWLVRCSAF